MDQQTQEAVAKWKTHRYKPNHLPFTEAVNSLLTETPLITLTRSAIRSNEWNVCHANTSTPAVMTFAGVFAEAEPYDSGNLVIGENEVPPGLNEVRITRFAGFKAAYSYAIETYHDKDIWDLQHTLDELAKETRGFNTAQQPRLEWQNGETQGWRFYIRVPMFLPYQGRGEKPKAPRHLHTWVKQAHERTRAYRANPNRPQVRAIEDGELRDIAQCTPSRLEYGDVVGLIFTVVYTETPANWSPVYMLTNIIRVMHANRDAYPLAASEEFDDVGVDDGKLSIAAVAPCKLPCVHSSPGL
ncbi:hypothetical protein OH76DRAFT_1342941 [Lentinus brumalis]|uniref:Uncharacterized protein n=1 Tax=Lentinus brumalis TaxID=2498619 RepID=A0A371DM82_9APHY|nr:hypothetical protein OH76DRAFT_1342941 [Polyporus brumalis]